jgi:hypothetical protein
VARTEESTGAAPHDDDEDLYPRHPLFPREDDLAEDRDVYQILVVRRRCYDGRTWEPENAWRTVKAADIQDWGQIHAQYGGGRYKLRAQNKRGQWSATYPAAEGHWIRLDGPMKRFDNGELTESVLGSEPGYDPPCDPDKPTRGAAPAPPPPPPAPPPKDDTTLLAMLLDKSAREDAREEARIERSATLAREEARIALAKEEATRARIEAEEQRRTLREEAAIKAEQTRIEAEGQARLVEVKAKADLDRLKWEAEQRRIDEDRKATRDAAKLPPAPPLPPPPVDPYAGVRLGMEMMQKIAPSAAAPPAAPPPSPTAQLRETIEVFGQMQSMVPTARGPSDLADGASALATVATALGTLQKADAAPVAPPPAAPAAPAAPAVQMVNYKGVVMSATQALSLQQGEMAELQRRLQATPPPAAGPSPAVAAAPPAASPAPGAPPPLAAAVVPAPAAAPDMDALLADPTFLERLRQRGVALAPAPAAQAVPAPAPAVAAVPVAAEAPSSIVPDLEVPPVVAVTEAAVAEAPASSVVVAAFSPPASKVDVRAPDTPSDMGELASPQMLAYLKDLPAGQMIDLARANPATVAPVFAKIPGMDPAKATLFAEALHSTPEGGVSTFVKSIEWAMSHSNGVALRPG